MAELSLQAPFKSTAVKQKSHGRVKLLVLWCAIAAVWGIILAWRYRSYTNPDGISYLDIADRTLREGAAALVNRYWSPLYPALIGLWERVHRPSPFGEFAYTHAINAAIYTVAAISFAYFLHQLLRFRASNGRGVTHEAIFITFGFALFFRFMNADVVPFAITPDLLVAAIAFASAGLFFRILSGQAGWRVFVALGIVLTLGYLAKSVMLPVGIILLCILLLWSPRSAPHRRGVLIAAITLCVLSAPVIALVSQKLGHLSISDAGRLNYLWYMDRIPVQGWTGSPGGDIPEHGPRIIEEKPKVIEFSSPVPGTYPLWYDPSYWYAGAKVHFTLSRQFELIRDSLAFYRFIFSDWRLPLEGLVALLILVYASHSPLGRTELVFLLWPLAVLSLYALVVNEYRYVAPFIVMICVAAFSAVLWQMERVQRILLAVLACVMIVLSLKQTVAEGREVIARDVLDPSQLTTVWVPSSSNVSADRIVARKLKEMGLKPGDAVATAGDAHLPVGDGFQDFCAHIDRLHIIAEIVDSPKFWSLSSDAAAEVERRIHQTGAKILLAQNKPKGFQSGLWQDISQTDYSVLPLRN